MPHAAGPAIAESHAARPWVGQSIPRVEDAALLTGRGRFIDDLGVRPGTLYAAILRSPHAHAEILSIDLAAALRADGVVAVLTGDDIKALTTSLVVGVKAPIECWPIAVGRVRYVGESVAVVVASDRYKAEDAVDLIDVQYRALAANIDPLRALSPNSPVVHDGFGGNIASDRTFRYGDPERAFAEAAHRISIDIRYPRNSCTPIETYGVVADYDASEDAFDILANFQGPFSIHAVISRALKVPGNRVRLRTPPDSGGSFGVKQGVFPYIVLLAAASRAVGRPVKWIEDRLEHLTASVSATNRATTLSAAVAPDGRISALDWDQVEDCGAHLRAPEPATLYRMHGNLTGAYDIANVAVRNRVVVTNKTPTGLNRGFGGPQVYFALERLMQRIAIELKLDPLDVIKRNLVPADMFPYRTATGALLDSGDYQEAIARGVRGGALEELKARRDLARAEGRLYGIGYAAVVEPSVSNMGYITTVLTAAERRKAGPKNGAQATATVAVDPLGSISVHVASVPQGQGHRTVLAQVVADVFGLTPADVRVNTEIDTAKDAWSIASGNYASRFAAAVAGTAKLAAERIAARLARVAASQFNTDADDIVFEHGTVHSRRNPDNKIAFSRLAGLSHWSPGTLPDDIQQTIRETVFWTPPELTAPDEEDRVNSSLCYGFIFDFCGVEIDRTTLMTRIDRYVTMHDCGTILHPGMVDGQIRGGFAQAPSHGDAVAVHAARIERRRGGQLHVDAGLHRQRGRRRARHEGCRASAGSRQAGRYRPRRRARAPRGTSRRHAENAQGRSPAPRRRQRDGGSITRGGLGHAARSGDASSRHPRLPRRGKDFRHPFPRRCHDRGRSGQGPLSGGSDALRPRRAAGGDTGRLRRGRPWIRQRRRPHHIDAGECRHGGAL